MYIHIYQLYGEVRRVHKLCTLHTYICSTTQRGKCLSGCTERVLQQLNTFLLSPNRAKDRKHFQPSAEEEGGTRKHRFRGEFSDDEEKGGCLEFWSTCFLND